MGLSLFDSRAAATNVVCEPQSGINGFHPTDYWYVVTPGPGESITQFRVETEDNNANDGSYLYFVQPFGWPPPTVGGAESP